MKPVLARRARSNSWRLLSSGEGRTRYKYTAPCMENGSDLREPGDWDAGEGLKKLAGVEENVRRADGSVSAAAETWDKWESDMECKGATCMLGVECPPPAVEGKPEVGVSLAATAAAAMVLGFKRLRVEDGGSSRNIGVDLKGVVDAGDVHAEVWRSEVEVQVQTQVEAEAEAEAADVEVEANLDAH